MDILEGLFGGPISCVPLPGLLPVLPQPEKMNVARRAKLSAASVDSRFVFMMLVRWVEVRIGGQVSVG